MELAGRVSTKGLVEGLHDDDLVRRAFIRELVGRTSIRELYNSHLQLPLSLLLLDLLQGLASLHLGHLQLLVL